MDETPSFRKWPREDRSNQERGSNVRTLPLGTIYPEILGHKPNLPANIPHSLDHLVHLAKFLGHFRVVRSMLVTTVIHTQEVSNQHIPFTTVHCEGEKTEHRGLRPTPQTQPGSGAPMSRRIKPRPWHPLEAQNLRTEAALPAPKLRPASGPMLTGWVEMFHDAIVHCV